MVSHISCDQVACWRDAFQQEKSRRVLQNAIMGSNLKTVAANRNALRESQLCFPDEIAVGSILAQQQSGRCWLFSALNTVRVQAMKKKNLSTQFAFSPNHLYFYDKLERSNCFLEEVIAAGPAWLDTLEGRRRMMYPVPEGGQWFMFVNLVKKYGLVPMEVMPETVHSTQSSELGKILNHIVRSGAAELMHLYEAKAARETMVARKEEILQCVYRYLCCTLGTPTDRFSYDYKDADGKFCHIEAVTPLEFAQDFWGEDPDEYICVVNAPGRHRPYHKMFTLENFESMCGGSGALYYNLEMDAVKELLIRQLDDGHTIWFGADCMNMMDRDLGVMHDEMYDYDDLFEIPYTMTKAEILDSWDSSPNHNMVIVGYKTYENGKRYWKVENSWGCKAGQQGFYIMNEGYLDRYTSEFIIHKKYLSPEQLLELEQEPIMLPHDDVLGT